MKGRAKDYLLLHGMLLVYSFCAVCSKLAAGYPFLSLGFCICYGTELLLLAGYAVGWQQILKRLPLTAAYSHKGEKAHRHRAGAHRHPPLYKGGCAG